jgi:hypothetical protein
MPSAENQPYLAALGQLAIVGIAADEKLITYKERIVTSYCAVELFII